MEESDSQSDESRRTPIDVAVRGLCHNTGY